MISCKLYGRTGNQLFQIAAVISHALKHGFEYRFPPVTINPEEWDKHGFDLPELTGLEKFNGYFQEPSHAFNEIPKVDDIILDGYFQSFYYFKDYIPTLRRILHAPDVTHWNTISIHVRRGDYLLYPDKHPVLPLKYYQMAVESIINIEKWNPKDIQITVYSDDFEWCRENFAIEKFGYPCYVKPSENEPPENDLFAMAMSQHNIISNSSYSYWAAILNPNPIKLVYTPPFHKWFGAGNDHLDTRQLLPDSWHQLLYY